MVKVPLSHKPTNDHVVIFDAFDFDQTKVISMDEMTILLLCALRGGVVMTDLGREPQDEAMESITIQAYGQVRRVKHPVDAITVDIRIVVREKQQRSDLER